MAAKELKQLECTWTRGVRGWSRALTERWLSVRDWGHLLRLAIRGYGIFDKHSFKGVVIRRLVTGVEDWIESEAWIWI